MLRQFLVTAIATAMFGAISIPAGATGIFVRDFQKFEADPQYDNFVHGYFEGLIEGEIVGLAMEARARTGDVKNVKAICIDPNDHYGADEGLRDVRQYLAAHPETPGDWTVGTIMAFVLADRYRCK